MPFLKAWWLKTPWRYREDDVESPTFYNKKWKIIDGGMTLLFHFIDTLFDRLFQHILREIDRLEWKWNWRIPQVMQPSMCLSRNGLSVVAWSMEVDSETRIYCQRNSTLQVHRTRKITITSFTGDCQVLLPEF